MGGIAQVKQQSECLDRVPRSRSIGILVRGNAEVVLTQFDPVCELPMSGIDALLSLRRSNFEQKTESLIPARIGRLQGQLKAELFACRVREVEVWGAHHHETGHLTSKPKNGRRLHQVDQLRLDRLEILAKEIDGGQHYGATPGGLTLFSVASARDP